MINKEAMIVSERLFSENSIIELAIEYFSKISYNKHRIFCNNMCVGNFDNVLILAGVEFIYDGLLIINRILLPLERVLGVLHEYMIYCLNEKIPDGERLPINYFCSFDERKLYN